MENIKKIIFAEPPSVEKNIPERFAGCTYELYHFPDLANLYSFTIIARAGYEVDYIDAVIEKLNQKMFLAAVDRGKPDILIIHSVILSKETDLYYLKLLRQAHPGLYIFLHGPEPTRVPEQYLLDDKIIVFRGELENKILGYIKNGTAEGGISRLENGRVRHYPFSGEPLIYDDLPYPMRNHPRIKSYINSYYNPKFKTQPYTAMMTSRGCAYHCRFCVPNSISFAREQEFIRQFGCKPKPNMASAGYVINEFKEIKKLGFKSVMITDDQFLWSKNRTLDICSGIKNLKIEWGCLSRADFLIDENVVKAMADSGCVSVDSGVESFSQEVLDDIQKNLRVEDIMTSLRLLKKYGIGIKLNIMLGVSPLQTRQEIIDTVKNLKKMGIENVMFSIATPFKGTRFYDAAVENGWLAEDTDKINPLKKSVISYPNLKKSELEYLQRYAYRSFYLRPRFLRKRLKNWINPKNLIRDVKIGIRILK